MKILITGGCGFIGSHLCQRLLQQGNQVYCIDNLMTGNLQNIQNFIKHPKFTFINANIRTSLIETLEKQSVKFIPEQIYHFACPASPIHYQNSSLQTLLTCLEGSINVLNYAQKCKARVLLASTSQIYGDPHVSPQTQDYWGNVNPVGVRSCYDQGKRASQTLFLEYNRVKNVDIRIVRIFNTYGPRLDQFDGRVISNFISQALRQQSITIYGDGSHTRSFCYVSDEIEGIIRLMNTPQYVGPINIGNPSQITVKQLAQLVIKLSESKSQVIYCKLPEDDPKRRLPDITKAKKYLNEWEPKISLQEGLIKTILYFRQLNKRKQQKICQKGKSQIKQQKQATFFVNNSKRQKESSAQTIESQQNLEATNRLE